LAENDKISTQIDEEETMGKSHQMLLERKSTRKFKNNENDRELF
jgi:hypothetical protein